MKLRSWPKVGTAKRIYVNSGFRGSVDTWIEPDVSQAGWCLRVRIKDAEAARRRKIIAEEIEADVRQELQELLCRQRSSMSIEAASWADWLRFAQ